jgi:hypothetical protein
MYNIKTKLDPRAQPPKLCRKCEHFIAPLPDTPLIFGRCALMAETIDLIDGRIESNSANYVTTAREFYCKGDWWEQAQKDPCRIVTK